MNKKSSLALIIILSLTIPIVAVSFVNASQVQSTQVPAASSQTWTFNLDSGDKFTGSLSISGGSGNDIDFSVTDPKGTTILGFGRVSQGRSFEFTATQSGAYTLHLGNTFSFFSSKTVSITYDITRPLLNTGIGDNSFLLIATVLIIIMLVVIIIGVTASKRSATRQMPQSQY